MIDKSELRAAILRQLHDDLELQTRAAQLARDEATSEESKAENKYDTRAQEAAYLAEGQARQAAELAEAIQLYQSLVLPTAPSPAQVGSCLRLRGDQREFVYFLGPRAGGLEISVGEQQVLVITPASPVGKQLLGATVGTTILLPGRPKPQRFTVVEIG